LQFHTTEAVNLKLNYESVSDLNPRAVAMDAAIAFNRSTISPTLKHPSAQHC
jgi:hypothetical protein